jgi:tetratricopeptide (TPR) repeat protein
MGIVYGDQYFNKSPRADHWVSLIGPGFWNTHHYCYALANVRRAEAAGVDAQRRTYLYKKAVADYYYTIVNSPSDLPLLPEIYTRMGEAYLRLNDLANAATAFGRAQELKPAYWPAYVRWIDVLIKLKRLNDAADLALRGLRHAPNSEDLRQRYIAAGGDPARLSALEAELKSVNDETASNKNRAVPSAPANDGGAVRVDAGK